MNGIPNHRLIAFNKDLHLIVKEHSKDAFQRITDTMYWYFPDHLYNKWANVFGVSNITFQGWMDNTSPISSILMKRIALWWIEIVEAELKIRELTK